MMKFRRIILGAVIALLSTAAASAQSLEQQGVPVLYNKIDQFAIAVDTSGSMLKMSSDAVESKLTLAKQTLARMNDRIPALNYTSSLYTVCPAGEIVAPMVWGRETIGEKVLGLPADLSSHSPLVDLGGDLIKQAGIFPHYRGALILATDGGHNWGNSAVEAARQLASFGILLHIISFADTPDGIADVAGMCDANPRSVCVTGTDIMNSDAEMDDFIKAVFYGMRLGNSSVYFATGSWTLNAAARDTLDQWATIIVTNLADVRSVDVAGFTDNAGGEGRDNQALSNNRALAVRDYLISRGVPTEKLQPTGNNVSYKFSNTTSDGRQHNRRVDVVIN